MEEGEFHADADGPAFFVLRGGVAFIVVVPPFVKVSADE